MAYTYSIITPVYDEGDRILTFLLQLEQMVDIEQAEVILIDGHDGSTIEQIDRRFSFTLRTGISPRGRGQQLIAGSSLASGKYLVFLHVDTKLPLDGLPRIASALQTVSAGAFRLRVESRRSAIRFFSRFAEFRNRINRTPYGDQTHFFTRDFYTRIGGYRPYPIMEDVELMRRLKTKKTRVRILESYAVTDDRRWLAEGLIRGTLRNWAIILLYRIGVSPHRLRKFYRPHSLRRVNIV
jgi:rSAM/selenodomain-associated transferase 2